MSGRFRILAITTMRNEGPFVLEWIAHHRALGVSDFLVFTNDCDDGTDTLLDVLQEHDLVEHVRQPKGGKSVQWRALRAAKGHGAYQAADWAMCIDCDEFVVLNGSSATLPHLIAGLDGDAIVLPWRLFGSGGALQFENVPVTERFTAAAPIEIAFPAAARFFKSLFRIAAFARPGIHRPKSRPNLPGRWLDGSGVPLPPGFAADDAKILSPTPTPATGLVQLNHYSLRSAEDFLVKRRRGLPNRSAKLLDASYWAERNFNAIEDRAIERHAAVRSQEMARLRDLPGIAYAHDACVAAHRERIAELLADPAEARLFTRLALLPRSVPPDRETARFLLEIVHRAGQ